jgi:hypothetical protein
MGGGKLKISAREWVANTHKQATNTYNAVGGPLGDAVSIHISHHAV